MNRVILGDNELVLPSLPERFARLIYIDPPFGTGRTQKRDRMRVHAAPEGERTGFGGRRYDVEDVASGSFSDRFADYEGFLMPRIQMALRCLTPDGSLFVHLDQNEVHYIKVALDRLLGRDCFMGEIIWAFDYGARSKTKWPAKHNTILWYALNPKDYVFDFEAMDRIPYMAPGLVTKEKAELGKTPTDTWWSTIVPTNGPEKTGYPTQKPLSIMNRIIKVHTAKGDTVLDFFAGSGSTGASALANERQFVLVDSNIEAFNVMQKRFAGRADVVFEPEPLGLAESGA